MQPLAPLTTIHNGKYIIIKTINYNDLIITYIALSTCLRKNVILKEFAPDRLAFRNKMTQKISLNSSEAAKNMAQLTMAFLEDAVNASKLSHPSIPSIVDIFIDNNTAYYVTDLIYGESLESLISKSIIPTAQAVKYISKVAEILRYIHSCGILHLNISPSNIIIRSSDNQPILTNLGSLTIHPLADLPLKDDEIDAPADWFLSPYNSIEPYDQKSTQSDLYSLTATLYKILTQQRPPTALSLSFRNILLIPSFISPPLQAFIRKGMSPQKQRRFQSADEFIYQLNHVSNGRAITLFVGIILLVIICIGGIFFF